MPISVAALAVTALFTAACGETETSGEAASNTLPGGPIGWMGYHWARTTNPFTIVIADTFTREQWRQILRGAVAPDWSASSVIEVSTTDGTGDCEAVDGRVQVCNKDFGFTGWLGLATIWVDADDHIVRAIVKMNDSYFDADVYNDPLVRQHVLCQEIGHTFGLDHQDTIGCMNETTGLRDSRYTGPSDDDYRRLELIYDHVDAYDTFIAPEPVATAQAGLTAQAGQTGLREISIPFPVSSR